MPSCNCVPALQVSACELACAGGSAIRLVPLLEHLRMLSCFLWLHCILAVPCHLCNKHAQPTFRLRLLLGIAVWILR